MEEDKYYIETHNPLLNVSRNLGFCHTLIYDYINKKCTFKSTHHLMNDAMNIYVTINSPELLKENVLNDILNEIINIHEYLIICYSVQKHIPFILDLYLTPFKKTLNYFNVNKKLDTNIKSTINDQIKKGTLIYNIQNFNNPLDYLHINSGSTTKNELPYMIPIIKIWREEEWKKILIHELIHLYDLEKGEYFAIKFPIVSNNFNAVEKELYTELQTWFLYIIYYNCDLNSEIEHSIDNVCKILKKYDINDINIFTNNDLHINNSSHIINISSSVLYYYIIKGILLYRVDLILDLLDPTIKKSYEIGEIENIYNNIVNDKKFIEYMNDKLKVTKVPEYKCNFTAMTS